MVGAYTLAAAAVIGAGVSVYGATQAGKSSALSNQVMGQGGTVFGEQQYYADLLQKLIADPSSVKSLPGYDFQFGQGADAVARSMASGGFGGSGNEAVALTQYGQGFAQNFYNTYEQQLAQLSGLTAASSPAQYTGAAVGANANANSQLSNALNSLGFFGALGAKSGIFGGGGTTPGADASALSAIGGGTMTMPNAPGYVFNIPGQ